MRGLIQELRHATRRLAGSLTFALAAILTLALAIGANVAMFAVVHRVVLNPLPQLTRGTATDRFGYSAVVRLRQGVRIDQGREELTHITRDLERDFCGNGYGGMQSAAGMVTGLAIALAGSRFIESLLYGISPRDPSVFAVTTVGLCVVALAACWVPARRAARLSPLEALRTD